jgi:hypothetical protein
VELITYMRMHGWGVVSNEDATITTVQAADNTAGTANIDITGLSTTQSITTDEIGAELYIEGMTGLEDGYYTLTGVTPVGGNTRISIAGNPANFSLSAGANSGNMRIEDHYKICNEIPDFVTGTNARARWYKNMVDITPSLSSEVETNGGITKVDGLTVTHNRVYNSDLSKVRWDLMNNDDTIHTSDRIYNATETTGIEVTGGIPYMGSSDNPDTAPTLGVYEPTWWGSECIRVDSATGSGPYTISITRALLRTKRWWHPYGQLFFDGFTTPAGKIADVIKHNSTDTGYHQGERIAFGPVTGIEYDNGVATQSLQISSDIFRLATTPAASEKALVNYTPNQTATGRPVVTINQISNDLKFGWLFGKGFCIRLSKDADDEYNIVPTGGSSEEFATETGYVYGKNRVTQRVIPQAIVEIDGELKYNGILTDVLRGDEFVNIQVPNSVPVQASTATPDEREAWENEYGSFILTNGTGIGGTTDWEFQLPKLEEQGYFEDVSPAHVFEPSKWPSVSFHTPRSVVSISQRRIAVNPIEVLLNIMLTRFGDGTNTFEYEGTTENFDILPPEFGLSILPEDIDIDSFMRVGYKFEENGFHLTNVYIKADERSKLKGWIQDNILAPYFLCITTDSQGRLRLTELADSRYKTSLTELDDADLFGADREPVQLSYNTSDLLSQITYEFKRPWINGNSPTSRQTVNYFYGRDGLSDHYRNLPADNIEIDPDFAPFDNIEEEEAFEKYLGRLMANRRHIMPILTCFVDESFGDVGDGAQVGQFISINLSRVPNAFGDDLTNLTAVGLVAKRQQDILMGVDQLDVMVVETLDLTEERAFSASVEVAAGSTGTVIQVEPDVFQPSDLAKFTTAQASFVAGDKVVLYDQFFTRKSFNDVEIDTISATEIEIDTDFEDSGGTGIVPADGDIIVLKTRADSTTGSQNQNAFVFNTSATAQLWES